MWICRPLKKTMGPNLNCQRFPTSTIRCTCTPHDNLGPALPQAFASRTGGLRFLVDVNSFPHMFFRVDMDSWTTRFYQQMPGGKFTQMWRIYWPWGNPVPQAVVHATVQMDTTWDSFGALVAFTYVYLGHDSLIYNRFSKLFTSRYRRSPKKCSRLPRKGAIVTRPLTLQSFGTISPDLGMRPCPTLCLHRCRSCPGLFGSTVQANPNFLSVRGSRASVSACFLLSKD